MQDRGSGRSIDLLLQKLAESSSPTRGEEGSRQDAALQASNSSEELKQSFLIRAPKQVDSVVGEQRRRRSALKNKPLD